MLEIIDKYLQKWKDLGHQSRPGEIEPEMADATQNEDEEWRNWNVIPSKVTDSEIQEFEESIGFKLPASFKLYLKHKHFYDLQIAECNLCSHPVNIWRSELSEMIFNGYPREYLIDKGRIPFANWSDWGYLCFDTTANCDDFDYPIVLWDHERADNFEKKYQNFSSMLYELDEVDKRMKDEE